MNRIIVFAKKIKHRLVLFVNAVFIAVFRLMKLKNRAFFYTIRSDGRLLENSKCVFDALDCEKVVFAEMLPHGFFDSLKAKRLLLTSKVVVTDDYLKYLRSVRLRDGQKVVQLWHASGAFKKFGLDAPSKLSPEEERATHSQYTDVCVSSEYVRRFYAQAFDVGLEVVKALGTPRTDALLDPETVASQRAKILSKHPELEGKRIYLYLPTFREKDGARVDLDPRIDWTALDAGLSGDEIFIVSRHPVMKKAFFGEGAYHNVIDLSDESTQDLLSAASAIVTDYSSVIFDACLLDLPIVFYCPDLNCYERDFYFDFIDEAPGKIIEEDAELLPSLRSSLSGKNDEKRLAFKEKEVGACDGHSTARIAGLIKDYLDR